MTLPALFRDDRTVASVPQAVAERVARLGCSILVTGETGTGKGYFASWLHRHGPRPGRGPLIPVNCGALPADIIDSQLFGHVRGAFSDASTDHAGLVRAAEGGTLLLDEVGELPAHAQCRLLRLLEDREVQPVGASQPIPVNLRVIAATSCDLESMVQDGSFRADLYYRLNTIRFHIRPLRERPAELVELVSALDDELARGDGGAPLALDADAWGLLRRYDWPGNVRELRAVLERLRILGADRIVTCDELERVGRLPSDREPARTIGMLRHGKDLRARTARAALESAGGNVSRAARELGVHRSTVHRWLATAS